MALIGVSHCPACGSVVNANWQSCLACSHFLDNQSAIVKQPTGEPTKDEMVEEIVEPSDEVLAFNLNLNVFAGLPTSDRRDFYPSGTKIIFKSPLWGELEAETLDDRGAVVWCWHPLQCCECCIPREWILGAADSLNER